MFLVLVKKVQDRDNLLFGKVHLELSIPKFTSRALVTKSEVREQINLMLKEISRAEKIADKLLLK